MTKFEDENNIPKKKAFFRFFEIYFQNFWHFMTINTIYWLLSIPIVTHGMACAGITNITRDLVQKRHSFWLSDFFETIRKNLKRALAVGVINTLVTCVMAYAIYMYGSSVIHAEKVETFHIAGLLFCSLAAIIFAMMQFYIYTLMITFNFSVKTLYKNSFKFVLANLGKNLLCGTILLCIYAVYIAVPLCFPKWSVIFTDLLIMFLTLPAFQFLLIHFFTFGSIKKCIIDPYYEEHPYEDIEMRRNMGLEVPEDIN